MGSGIRVSSALALALVLGLALAVRDAPPPRQRTIAKSPGGFYFPSELFIGAWCSPRTSTTDPEVWRDFARAGLDLAVRPLEDTNDRARNLATLALLDSMRAAGGDGTAPRFYPRDDAVHPDEAARPGWRDRVRAVVAAYRGHRSLGGYFLADEPQPADFDRVADVAAAFADADPGHPAYVNLLPISANASVGDQERWREDAKRLIRRGKLKIFTFSAYSQRPWGEDATFLLTLQNAARVSRETGCRFATVLQFTGFGPLDPMPLAQLNYLVAESIAHGAAGIIWFTYWTPSPREEGMWWKGGAVPYDGSASSRADTLRLANVRARSLDEYFQFQGARTAVAHLGGAWPHGATLGNQRIAGLRAAFGGPITIAARSRDGVWLVINRDRAQARTIRLDLQPWIGVRWIVGPHGWDRSEATEIDPAVRSVTLALGPGDSAILGLTPR